MAATQSASEGNFYNIVQNSFRKKVEEGTEGAIMRKNKKEVEVYELSFDNISGMIVNIEVKETPFGQNIQIKLDDGDILSLGISTNEGKAFTKVMASIDPLKKVEFNVFEGSDGKGAFLVKQEGNAIKWNHTRAVPNGMPDAIQKTVAGVTKWDFSDQDEFLYQLLLKQLERFGGQVPVNNDADFPEGRNETANGKPPTEDLPF